MLLLYSSAINLQYTLLLLIPLTYKLKSLKDRVFTIHFATINTLRFDTENPNDIEFTIHFATINTNR